MSPDFRVCSDLSRSKSSSVSPTTRTHSRRGITWFENGVRALVKSTHFLLMVNSIHYVRLDLLLADAYIFYWYNLTGDFFTPAFQCPHRMQRVGTLGDGGKWVCGMERIEKKKECVIYSAGVNGESSFEAALLERAPGCQVYGYDFSVNSVSCLNPTIICWSHPSFSIRWAQRSRTSRISRIEHTSSPMHWAG